MTAPWVIGLSIGLVLVVVVVILLVLMILGASRAADKVETIVAALEEARDNTEGLWQLAATNTTATRIVRSAAAARTHLATDQHATTGAPR